MRGRQLLLPLGPLLLLLGLLSPRAGRAEGDALAGTAGAAGAAEGVNTESIDNLPMPPTVESAFQEVTRNNDQIDAQQNFIGQKLAALAEEKERFEAERKTVEGAWRQLAAMAGRCAVGREAEVARRKLADDSKTALRALNRIVKGDPTKYTLLVEDDLKDLCSAKPVLRLLRDDAIRDGLDDIEAMRARWVQGAQQQIEGARKIKDARVKLRSRLEGQLGQLRTSVDKTVTFVSDLKWLVMILGVLSVLVMFIIRTFPTELQIEWVASGQVIQFMTVLIILITILALGITGVLKENTLGTLLGGIGGYVLSQGIGRAAARSAVRMTENKIADGMAAAAAASAPPAAPQAPSPQHTP